MNSDKSLSKISDEFDQRRLPQISIQGHSFWGIPARKHNVIQNKNVFNITFNGIQLKKTNRIFPILTMLALSYETGNIINGIIGRKDELFKINNMDYLSKGTGSYRLGLVGSTLLGLPFSGALNNWIWDGISVTAIPSELNQKLGNINRNIDVFVSPEYDYYLGFWSQKISLKVKYKDKDTTSL